MIFGARTAQVWPRRATPRVSAYLPLTIPSPSLDMAGGLSPRRGRRGRDPHLPPAFAPPPRSLASPRDMAGGLSPGHGRCGPRLLRGTRLVGAAARDYCGDRLGQDGDVQPERPALDVVEVEPDQLVEREVRPAGDLPQARHARKDERALPVPVLEPLVVANRERPRADEA